MSIPRIAITSGEPAGIGPDLVIKLAQQQREDCELIVIGDRNLLRDRAKQLGLTVEFKHFDPGFFQHEPCKAGEIHLVDMPLAEPANAGQLNTANANYVINMLDEALDGCRRGYYDAMVTAPVNKAVINDAGIPFSGHTEYLRDKSQVSHVVMMLATEGLRVALATTHLPLRDVADAITAENLTVTLDILLGDLQKHFGIAAPRILVAGLNPHAGEGGHLGSEEHDIIEPALQAFAEKNPGCTLTGPLPADTLFTEKYLSSADAVLAMYHDQGLPVLKYKGFGKACNITLGLPFIRTSVDHGTALDLAGTGNIDGGSLDVAIDTAIEMANASKS